MILVDNNMPLHADTALVAFIEMSLIPLAPIATVPASEALFRRLASDAPAELVRRIEEDVMTPGLLARATEALGRVEDIEVAVPVLLGLLEHAAPVVREAAIYGLENYGEVAGVADVLRARAVDLRELEAIRAAAREALEALEE